MTSTPIPLLMLIPPGEWLTANGRYHWAERKTRTRLLRQRAHLAARQAHLPHLEHARLTVYVHTRTRTRMDPLNAAPTVKAVVDGLIDWGLLPDDDHEHLEGPDLRRGRTRPDMPNGYHALTIQIEPGAV